MLLEVHVVAHVRCVGLLITYHHAVKLIIRLRKGDAANGILVLLRVCGSRFMANTVHSISFGYF